MTGSGSGLLALGALGSQTHLPVKDEKNHHDLEHRGVLYYRVLKVYLAEIGNIMRSCLANMHDKPEYPVSF